jgi:hypothetical protein
VATVQEDPGFRQTWGYFIMRIFSPAVQALHRVRPGAASE